MAFRIRGIGSRIAVSVADLIAVTIVASLTLPAGQARDLGALAATAAPFWLALAVTAAGLAWWQTRLDRDQADRTWLIPSGLPYGALLTVGVHVIGMTIWALVYGWSLSFLGIGAVALVMLLCGWRLAVGLILTPRSTIRRETF